jgi:hypothetical protein
MDQLTGPVYFEFLVVKPIGKAEVVIRREQIYELNGPYVERPAVVGIMHAYGKKEEVLIPIHAENYYWLRQQLTGITMSEEERNPVAAPTPQGLKFDKPPLNP